jgi:hypothetical protein
MKMKEMWKFHFIVEFFERMKEKKEEKIFLWRTEMK